MVNLDAYPKPVIDRAFYLQRKIKRDGLDGIGYMNDAFLVMNARAEDTTEREIEKNLRSRGLI